MAQVQSLAWELPHAMGKAKKKKKKRIVKSYSSFLYPRRLVLREDVFRDALHDHVNAFWHREEAERSLEEKTAKKDAFISRRK